MNSNYSTIQRLLGNHFPATPKDDEEHRQAVEFLELLAAQERGRRGGRSSPLQSHRSIGAPNFDARYQTRARFLTPSTANGGDRNANSAFALNADYPTRYEPGSFERQEKSSKQTKIVNAVKVALRTTPLSRLPQLRHNYVTIEDFISEEGPVIVAAFPENKYDGNSSEIMSDSELTDPDGTPMLFVAQFGGDSGTDPIVDSAALDAEFEKVIDEAKNYINHFNSLEIPYRPHSTNSNYFAQHAFEHLVGQFPKSFFRAPGSGLRDEPETLEQ